MYPWEMMARGVKPGFADLIISPQPPFHFRIDSGGVMRARGQHDSLAGEAQRIGALMWGRGIKKGLPYQELVYPEDFAPTMAWLLGINAPLDATGRVLDGALEMLPLPPGPLIKIEDEAAVISGDADRYRDEEASGGTAVNLRGEGTAFEISDVPAADQITIRYAATGDCRLLLFVNGRPVRPVFFPASDGFGLKYDTKRINYTLQQGDTVRFVLEEADPAGIKIDCLFFSSRYIFNM